MNVFCQILSAAALVLSLSGNVLINRRVKSGFIVWMASNVAWIVVNVLEKPNWYMIAMFVVYILFNLHGWLNWGERR